LTSSAQSNSVCGWLVWAFFLTLSVGCARGGADAQSGPQLKTSWKTPTELGLNAWRYHPKKAATSRAALSVLADTLLAGDRGERWLVRPNNGDSQPATTLAPETLVEIVRPNPSDFWFVGASGTVYQAESPLGPFVRSTAPSEPLAQIAAAPTVLLGVTQRGSLIASRDAGVVWEALPQTIGQRFVDVAIDSNGTALALSIPEKLWVADLPQLSFSPLALPTVGALSLESADGQLKISGLYENYALTRERSLTPVPLAQRAPLVKLTPPLGPDATALLQGRASLSAGYYREAREGENGWDLLSGRVGENLKRQHLPSSTDCKLMKLAASGGTVYFLCGPATGGGTQELALYRSLDGGLTFKREPYPVLGNAYSLRMAAGPNDHLLLTGICDSGETGTSCQPGGIFFRDPGTQKAGRRTLRRALISGLRGTAQVLGFSEDGKRAFAVGVRDNALQTALFLSKDGGASFETTFTEASEATQDSQRPGRAALGTAIRAANGPNGSLAVTFEGGGNPAALVFDEAGQLLARARPPETARFLAAAGTNAVAWSEITGHLFGTLDAGASWENLGPPPAKLCEPSQRCSPTLACEASGCVFSDLLTKVGWTLSEQPKSPLLGAPEVSTQKNQRRVRTPVSCQLSLEPWVPLAGATYAPAASDAAIGEVDWMLPAVQARERSVDILHQRGAKLERLSLLAKVAQPTRFAFNVYSQIEGIAAIRYPLPTPADPQLRDVELAWANYFTKEIVHRAKLPDAGGYLPGDYKQSERDSKLQEAQADLVSIAEGGVFVRPHQSPRNNQITYYLNGHSVAQIPPVPWPKSSLDARLAPEIAVVAGQFLPLLLETDGALIVRARAQADKFEFSPMTTGLLSAESAQLVQRRSIVYVNGAAALYVHQEDVFGTFSQAFVFPFQIVGPPVGSPQRVPTQLDTPDPPLNCNDTQRKTTPRTISLFTGGTRHPVFITQGSEPLRTFLTTNAVLYGTLENPCVAMFDAQPLKEERPEAERALVSIADNGRSFLFRRKVSEELTAHQIEYKPMHCQLDASISVPEEVYEGVGTRAIREK